MADWVQSVNAATNGEVIPGYTSGSPNKFVGTVPNPLPSTIDGVALTVGVSIILVKDQPTSSQNGIFQWTSGSGSTAVWSQQTPYTPGTDFQVSVRVGPGSTTSPISANQYTHWTLKDATTTVTWVRQFTRVNVRDFGAKGDGTDDYASITTAMNSLPASGGTLLFPAGKSFSSPLTYAVTSNALSIPANVQVAFEEGAILAPGNQKTVTIQGRILAHPTQQIFGGTGTLTTVSHVGTGGGTISLSGGPQGSYSFAVQIMTGGSSPTFQYSLNYSASGGTVWSTTQNFTSSYNVPSAGVTITFSGSFTVGDIYTWSSGPPVLVNASGATPGTDRFPVKWWGALGNGRVGKPRLRHARSKSGEAGGGGEALQNFHPPGKCSSMA